MDGSTPAELLALLDASRVKAHVEEITTRFPSRLAGTDAEKGMAHYSAAALRQAGLASRVHEITGLVSFPERASLRVLGPEGFEIAASTLGHSVQTPPDGLEGELVYVGSGGLDDYAGLDVRGKIILTELSYSPARHEKHRIAALNGAAGCLMMNWGNEEDDGVPFGSVKQAWGNPTPETMQGEMPTLPCAGIGRRTGLQLKQLVSQRPVRVHVHTKVVNEWRDVHFTTADLAGGQSGDFVIIGGHQDSWFGPSATDNAIGSACVYEVVRALAQHRGQLRRGVRVALWTGHETGTMVSSSWYADQHWDELDRHAVAYVQIDQPACLGTTCWETSSNPELKRFHQGIERSELGGCTLTWHLAPKIGDASFFGLGVPMMTGQGGYTQEELKRTARAFVGWWHHSVHNTMDKIDWDYVPAHLRVYARYLWHLCTDAVLPFEFGEVARRIEDRLQELQCADDPLNLRSALEHSRSLTEATSRLDRVTQSWRERYRAEPQLDADPARRLDACLKVLSRALIPVTATVKGRYGHDPYGHSSLKTYIPSLYEAPSLYALARGSEHFRLLRTRLVRQRNWLVDTLRGCVERIETTLRDVPDETAPASAAVAVARRHLPRAEDFLLWPPGLQVYGYRQVDRLFASRTISRGNTCTPLARSTEVGARYRVAGREYGVAEFLDRNCLSGLLVLQDGKVRLERYALGLQEGERWSTMSTVKSMTAMLVGAAVQDGAMRLDETVARYLPALAGSAYEHVKIRDLLTMSSGVEWTEDYEDRFSDVNRYSKSLADKVSGGVFAMMRKLRAAHPPGTFWNYNTGDTYLLGAALTSAVGETLASYMARKIWQPCGMEFDAFYTLESEGGQEIGGSRAGVALRDFGRFANFVLDGGVANGKRLLPQGWVDASARAAFTFDEGHLRSLPRLRSGGLKGYGYSWWIDADGAMIANGFAGQRIYVNRTERLAVVTLGAFPQRPYIGAGGHDHLAEVVRFTDALRATLAREAHERS